jgi:acyl-CoA synthetase (AMP-forming)/AMP-acid ligase II/acyl carrier protein
MLVNDSMSSLVEALIIRAESEPGRILYRFPDADGLEMTASAIWDRAKSIAAQLQPRKIQGQRVLLLCEPGPDYVMAFLGVACAGGLPVPMFPPSVRRLEASLPRALAIANNCEPTLALTAPELMEPLRAATSAIPALRGMSFLAANSFEADAGASWQKPRLAPSDVAFLQYTSGSTRTPRGVMVTHDNLRANADAISKASSFDEHPIGVSWLPPYHDMGLIGTILQAIYSGMRLTLLSPQAFLRRPLRWLSTVSEQRANYSGGPNFAYELCARRAKAESFEGIDLSCWKVAFSGAEPVHPKTIRGFCEAFARVGFEPDFFAPSYGLAEATLLVTSHRGSCFATVEKARLEQGQARASEEEKPRAVAEEKTTELVSCGKPFGTRKVSVRIVASETLKECAPGTTGEIWLAGESIAAGYWNEPAESAAVFGAQMASGEGPYLRTGDLGMLLDGNLFVLGRIKDLIIVNGRNHYPQDLEYSVECAHPAVRQGGVAVFAVPHEQGEAPIVVCEVAASKAEELSDVIVAIQEALLAAHELAAHDVVLIAQRTLPKTSSGKVQRAACKRAFLDGALSVRATARTELRTMGPSPASPPAAVEADVASIEQWIVARLANAAGIPGDGVDPQRPFASFGIDSVVAVDIATSVQKQFGIELGATALWDFPSARLLAKHLAQAITVQTSA